jgi:hypothetical protein
MAIRVARGLFRLWVVISVLWIGGVGTVTWRTFPTNEGVVQLVPVDYDPFGGRSDRAQKSRPDECRGMNTDQCMAVLKAMGRNPFDAFDPAPPLSGYAVESSPPGAGMFNDLIPKRVQSTDGVVHEFPPGTPDDEIARLVNRYRHHQAFRVAVLLAVIPPGFLLIFGSALVWAFRGFRPI